MPKPPATQASKRGKGLNSYHLLFLFGLSFKNNSHREKNLRDTLSFDILAWMEVSSIKRCSYHNNKHNHHGQLAWLWTLYNLLTILSLQPLLKVNQVTVRGGKWSFKRYRSHKILAEFHGFHILGFWAVLYVLQSWIFHEAVSESWSRSRNLKSQNVSGSQIKTIVLSSRKVSNLPFATSTVLHILQLLTMKEVLKLKTNPRNYYMHYLQCITIY